MTYRVMWTDAPADAHNAPDGTTDPDRAAALAARDRYTPTTDIVRTASDAPDLVVACYDDHGNVRETKAYNVWWPSVE